MAENPPGVSSFLKANRYNPKRQPHVVHDKTYIGIKHGFSCINIRQVPREVLKTEAGGRGFQHLPLGPGEC